MEAKLDFFAKLSGMSVHTGVSVPTEKERHQKAERDTSALAPAQPRCLIGLQRRHLRQIYSPT
ncbi:hypothetical protein J6590_084938, partial [Homalodisca vitripennis]